MSTSTPETSLQVRSYQTRAAVSQDGRTIEGIGVPYGVEIEYTPGFFERFEPGSVDDEDAILRYGHAEPLGILKDRADTDEGRKITGIISDTQRGRDIATLIKDGALSKFSIGFYPVEYTDTESADGLHRTYQKVKAVEYSVVEFPAYPTASINEIRSTRNEKEPTMTTNTVADLEARAAIDTLTVHTADELRELRSQVALLTDAHDAAPQPMNFRSLGEYAHALAVESDALHVQAREAFEGAVTSKEIARPSWLGVLSKRMTAKQPVTNMFAHTMDLPASGMTIEYALRKSDSTVKVNKQDAEGAALALGKPSTYKIESAPVETYGGAGQMSLQAIERASISVLDDLLYDQALEYARRIETATRSLFAAKVEAAESQPVHTFASLDGATVDQWMEFALALIDKYDATAHVMDGIAVSPTVFAALAKMPRDPKALQFTGAPTDHQGTLTIRTGSADFATLNVQRIPNWDGAHAVGYSREAIRIKEAPGAPLRLQDSNILDLTKAFAVYGYAAHFAPHPELLMAAKFTA